MVSLLTGTSDSVLDTAGMPSSDTSDLAETLVSLARKLLGVPTAGDTWRNTSSLREEPENTIKVIEWKTSSQSTANIAFSRHGGCCVPRSIGNSIMLIIEN